jgi:hypothetical protein
VKLFAEESDRIEREDSGVLFALRFFFISSLAAEENLLQDEFGTSDCVQGGQVWRAQEARGLQSQGNARE